MCLSVIIHIGGGGEIECRTQRELIVHMDNGLSFDPPPTYAMKSQCPGFYVDGRYIPEFDLPTDSELIERWGLNPECCLCPVDLERTAEMNGFASSENDPSGEFDPFSRHFYKEEQNNGETRKN